MIKNSRVWAGPFVPLPLGSLAAPALLLLSALVFSDSITGAHQLFQRDIHTLWRAQMASFVNVVQAGSLPLWNPYLAFGRPLLADPGYQVLYPWTWVYLFVSLPLGYALYSWLHIALCGLGVRKLAHLAGLSPLGAFGAGSAALLSGPLLSYVNLTFQLAGAAWLPWTVAAALQVWRKADRPSVLRLALVLSMQVLAGSGEMIVAAGTVIGAGAVVGCVRRGFFLGRRGLAALGLAGLLGGALSAVQWAPTIALVHSSNRQVLDDHARGAWALHPARLVELAIPSVLSDAPLRPAVRDALFNGREPLLNSIHIGGVVLALGLLAAIRGGGLVHAAIGAAAVFTFAALGPNTPLWPLLSVGPLSPFRFPEKWMLPAALALALMCGAGLDTLRAPWTDVQRRRARTLVAVLAMAGVFVAATALTPVGANLWLRIADGGLEAARSRLLAPVAAFALIVMLISWRTARPDLSARSPVIAMALTLVTAPEKLNLAIAEAISVIHEAVAKGLKHEEIERVKTSLEADVVGSKETVEGYARRLGNYYHQFGDPQYESRYLEQILAVESEAAILALSQILKNAPTLSMAHPNSFKVEKSALETLLKVTAPTPAKIESAPAAVQMKKYDGAKVLIKTANHLPIISMRWIFAGGAREERPQEYGSANLFQRTWTSGTQNHSALEIAHTLESLGASLHAFAGRHTLGLSFECLRKQWPLLKPLLREVLIAPKFPDEEVHTERDLMLREILSEKDSPGSVCQINFANMLYGKHSYGRSMLGTTETVSKLGPKELTQFYRRFVHRGNLVVSAVGAFDEGFWQKELEPLLKELPATGDNPAPANFWTAPDRMRITTEVKQPLFQSHILVGFPATTLFEPERYSLKLLSSCLSGQGGRLFMELRDRQSLAYTVAPMSSDSPERGMFGVYIGCAPEKLQKALSGIRLELAKVIDKPITPKELARAKQYWLGRYELDMQRFLSQAMTFGLDEYYGLGNDHWKKIPAILNDITAETIRKSAEKYLQLDRATISVVHPEQLSEATITEMWKPAPAKQQKRSAELSM